MIEWSRTRINRANTNLRLDIKEEKITDYSLQLFNTGSNIIISCMVLTLMLWP